MKHLKIILSLLVVAAVALSMSLVSCAPTPQQDQGGGDGAADGPTPWTGPKIEIVVKLLADASNLYDPIGGVTNTVRIVGSIGGLKLASDTRVVLSNWEPKDPRAVLSFVSNASDGFPLYKIVLANDLTNGRNIEFKFVNGSPGEPSDWALVEKTADGGEVNNRTALITPNQDVFIYHTNNGIVSGSGVDVHPNGIQKWASVGPTYNVRNVHVLIIVSNVGTSSGGNQISRYAVSGSFNNWAGTPDPDNPKVYHLLTNANGVTVSFWLSNYQGPASVAFKLRGQTPNEWLWAKDPNHSFGVPLANKNGGTLTNKYIFPGW